MKVGLIRCLKTEETCGGKDCLEFIDNQEGPLVKVEEEVELVAMATCGGCPGNKVGSRIKNMVKNDVEIIILASCISLGTPIEFSCPYHEKLKDNILQEGKELTIFEGTHPETFKEILFDRIKNNNLKNFFKTGMKI